MPGLIGKKIGMTSIFDKDGKNYPCTVIELGPCLVTQIKTKDVDGYAAVQVAFGAKKRPNKSEIGHAKKSRSGPLKNHFEFRDFDENEVSLGDALTVDMFTEGEYVDVAGTSKGKGFQGVVKRHGFAGVGQATHGQHNRLRAPGSIGAGSDPSRVFKGTRMGGRMGNERVKIQNLQVLKVDLDQNLLVVKGSVPGAKQSLLIVEK